jgi:hypothetical protein
MKLYADRLPFRLEPFYSMHVSAMTLEGLHLKSAIAAELAFRDAQIASLQKELSLYRTASSSYVGETFEEVRERIEKEIKP